MPDVRLPASGQISFSQINQTLCNPIDGVNLSLNDYSVRQLFNKLSGQIATSDGYGKNGAPSAGSYASMGCYGSGDWSETLNDGSCSFYQGTVNYANDCNNCNGQGATGDGSQNVNGSEYCVGVDKYHKVYLNNSGCAQSSNQLDVANTCECGGTDGHSVCDTVNGSPVCLGVDEVVYYWCSCANAQSLVIVYNSQNCGGDNPGATCPC